MELQRTGHGWSDLGHTRATIKDPHATTQMEDPQLRLDESNLKKEKMFLNSYK